MMGDIAARTQDTIGLRKSPGEISPAAGNREGPMLPQILDVLHNNRKKIGDIPVLYRQRPIHIGFAQKVNCGLTKRLQCRDVSCSLTVACIPSVRPRIFMLTPIRINKCDMPALYHASHHICEQHGVTPRPKTSSLIWLDCCSSNAAESDEPANLFL